MFIAVFQNVSQRFLARFRGDLVTEFSPLAQNENRKIKRTIYQKISHGI